MAKDQTTTYINHAASMKSSHSDLGLHTHQHSWSPPTDVYETTGEIVVRVEISGVKIDDFDIDFSDGVLAIRGNRTDVSKRKAFHQMEIRYGNFYVNLKITIPVISSEITAEYRDGFLLISLPKAETRHIQINSD